MAKKTVAAKKRNVKVDAMGQLHVHSSFNNIIVSLANSEGQIISWSSAEKKGIDEINIQVLRECGMTSKNDLVKILADGELKAKLTVKAHAFSKKAIEAIQAVGGTAEVVNNKKAEAAENK